MSDETPTNSLKRTTNDTPERLTGQKPDTSLAASQTRTPNTASRTQSSSSSSSSSSDNFRGPQVKYYSPNRSRTMSSTKRKDREALVSNPSDQSRAQKEAAIRNKLRTYEAALALKEGYMPSTEQVTAWARYALRASGVLDSRSRTLSVPGRTFVRDLRAWVEAIVELGLSKNSDDKIQEFIHHTSNAHVDVRGPGMKGAGAVVTGARPSGKDMQKVYSKMRLLGTLLYSSPEFRKLLNDITIVSQDIFADAASAAASVASAAAEKYRPDEDASQIEKSAGTTLGDPNDPKAAPAIPSASQVRSMAKKKGTSYMDALRKQTSQSKYDMESYLREKFPKQRRDAVINRLKNIISEIQKNPDFNDTVGFLIEIAQKYIGGIKDKLMKETSNSKPSIHTDEHFDQAIQDMKAILMVFADGKSLDDISDAASRVIEDIQNDEDLKNFYDDVANFFDRALKEGDFVTSDSADAEAHALYDRSSDLLSQKQDKYNPDMQRLFTELKSFCDAMSNDRENRRVVETSKKVFADLVNLDSHGEFKSFKARVIRDIMDVLLPRFIGEVRYIPIPRIEYQDRGYDLILENLILESEHFLPYRSFFEAVSRAEFVNDYVFSSKYSGSAKLLLQNINLYAKDISFIVRKKTGLIPFNDEGFLDIFMDGRGASAEIILESASSSDDEDDDAGDSYFHIRSVHVTIHRFKYKYNAYHTWAAALLSPFIRPAIRRIMSSLLEQKIKEMFESADREMRALAERMRVASIANKGGGSVEAWVRAVLSRPDGMRRGSGSGGGSGGGYRVNIGVDEMFPGEFPPGGVLGKIRESTERVAGPGEDEGWRSSIFDIGA